MQRSRVFIVSILTIVYLLSTNMNKKRSEGEAALHVLLLSTWSSGSTFVSKLLSHYPGVYLTFEPLVLLNSKGAIEDKYEDDSIHLLEDIFKCNYSNQSWGSKLLWFLKTGEYKEWTLHNDYMRKKCNEEPSLCYSPGFVSLSCENHPVQLIKTVRLRTRQAQRLLNDEELNLKIIVLLRDPRAVRSSRNKRVWCNFGACNSVEQLCNHYEDDLSSALRLSRTHPHRILIAKYEEIVTFPNRTIPILFKFLNLPWNSRIDSFISDHMMIEAIGKPESQFHAETKQSRALAGKWKDRLEMSEILKLGRSCNTSIEKHERLSMIDT